MPEIWGVEVSYEDDDPATYGPYTERQAERVEERLNKEILLAHDSNGYNHHPHGVRHANAFTLGRYNQFLSAAERMAMRDDKRAAEEAADARRADY